MSWPSRPMRQILDRSKSSHSWGLDCGAGAGGGGACRHKLGWASQGGGWRVRALPNAQ